MVEISENYDRLKRLLRDREFTDLSHRLLEIQARIENENDGKRG